MGKRKLIAIAYGDHHIGDFQQFSNNHSRLHKSLDVFRILGYIAESAGVPILNAGDLFEVPKHLANVVIQEAMSSYRAQIHERGVPFYVIDGNHDQSESNTITHRSPNYVSAMASAFDTIHHLENGYKDTDNFRVFGIPYLKRNEGFVDTVKALSKKVSDKKPNILLIHTDLYSVRYPNGMRVEEVPGLPKRMDKLFKAFDLVLASHIHRKKRVSKKIIMMGAPQQQSLEDSGLKMGYWEVYSDMSVKFKHLDMYPEFRFIEEDEPMPDNFHYYTPIKRPKVKSSVTQVESDFNPRISQRKLVRNYLKELGMKDRNKMRTLTKLLDEASKES
jgi:DNA repair exonuclease SbcCD nuclease subunit